MSNKRQVFYSFHYMPDCWRASMVRNIGAIEGNRPATDNDWEQVVRGGEAAIKRWIDDQLKNRSCTVVLIGTDTANRPWINYEIVQSWNKGMGVVGIHIHGLKNRDQNIATKGPNPFDSISYGSSGNRLSSIVKCYDPVGLSSEVRYAWISQHLSAVVEEAVEIRGRN